jgi:hypothetical protein
MLRRVEIDDDLELAERALRGLAEIYRETAERQLLPILRDGFEVRAQQSERAADRITKRLRSQGAKSCRDGIERLVIHRN